MRVHEEEEQEQGGQRMNSTPVEDQQRQATIETAAAVARALGETEDHVRRQLLRCVRLLGPDLARDLLEETLRIDGEGGERVRSGRRARTPGGIYFRLVRDRTTPAQWASFIQRARAVTRS